MKRSEFAKIVNAVADDEAVRIAKAVDDSRKDAANNYELAKMIATVISEIPAIAARTTAEILIRSGIISVDDDSPSD